MTDAIARKVESRRLATYFIEKIKDEDDTVKPSLMNHLMRCARCRGVARKALGIVHKRRPT